MKTLDEQIEIARRRLRQSWAANFPRLEKVRLGEEELDVKGQAHWIREDFVDENIDDMLADMASEYEDEYTRFGISRKDF